MKKVCIFVPADKNNDKFFTQFENSLRKFHSEVDLPLIRIEGHAGDPQFWYRAKPIIATDLLKEYETVIGADADQIVCGDISDIWQGDFDVACVRNDPNYPIQLMDISPYFNNGIVVMKSKEFVAHWLRLCLGKHFDKFQYREQDILNMLASDYHDYNTRDLDNGNMVYGESGKPLWALTRLDGDKIVAGEKEIKIVHFGGGADDPTKGNYRIRFPKEVIKKIEWLIK